MNHTVGSHSEISSRFHAVHLGWLGRLAMAFLFWLPGLLEAADLHWASPRNGNWGAATNWSPAQVPTLGDSVYITNGGSFVVTVNIAAQAGQLVLGGETGSQTLSNATQTLTVSGPAIIQSNGVLRLTGGVFAGAGDTTVEGRFDWNGGTLNRPDTLAIAPGATLFLGGAATRTITNGTILNQGTTVWGSGTIQTLSGSVLFTNAPGALLEITNFVTWNVSTSDTNARIANAGVLRRRGAGTGTVGATIENFGSVELLGGTLSLSSTNGFQQFAGTTTLNGGSLTLSKPAHLLGGFLSGTGVVAGILVNDATVRPGLGAGQLNISGSYTQGSSGLLEIELGGTSSGTNADRLAVSGTISLDGTVAVSLVDGFIPSGGDVFRFVTGSSRRGTFASFQPAFAEPRLGLMHTNNAVLLQTFEDSWTIAAPREVHAAELAPFQFSFSPTPSLPAYQRLTYSISNAPPGAGFNVANGALSWTPTEAQGPGSYAVTVTATDNGSPPRSRSHTLTILVDEANTAPRLSAVGDRTAFENTPFRLQLAGADSDLPPNLLTFSLLSGPPEMTVDPQGELLWTPPSTAVGTTNAVRVKLADDGIPSLSQTQSFQIVVLPRLLAYEGFDYGQSGADLVNSDGGFGFLSPWLPAPVVAASSANFDLASPTLDYPGLGVAGQSVRSAALSFNAGALRRTLAQALGLSNTVRYLSFLLRPDGTVGAGQINGYFGVRLLSSGGADLFIGKPGGGATNRYVIENAGGTLQHASTVPVTEGLVALLVVKMEFFATTDRFTLYVNPDPTAPEPASGILKFDSNVGTVTNLCLNNTGAFSVDELRIGTDWAAVVPPSTVAPIGLQPVPAQTVDEESTMNLRITPIEPPVPPRTFTYSLRSAPSGATLDPVTGDFSWTPTEAQGPSSPTVTIDVTDNEAIRAFGSVTFSVAVNEVNRAPELTIDSSYTLLRGQSLDLNLALRSSDRDLPANTLSYSLLSGPPGLTLSAAGALTWVPSEGQWGGNYRVMARVTDNGSPSLSADRSFLVSTLNTTNLEVDCPRLRIELRATNVLVAWPIGALGFGLQSAPILGVPEAWNPVDTLPAVVGEEQQVVLAADQAASWFRLFSVGSGAPVITRLSVGTNAVAIGASASLEFRFHDPDCNLASVELTSSNALGTFSLTRPLSSLAVGAGGTQATVPLRSDLLTVGANTLSLRLIDSQGNRSESSSVDLVLAPRTGVGSPPRMESLVTLADTWQRPRQANTRLHPPFRVAFSDPDRDAARLRVIVRPPGQAPPVTTEVDIASGADGAGTLSVAPYTFVSTNEPGVYACEFVLFDRSGNASGRETNFVQLALNSGRVPPELTSVAPPNVLPGGLVELGGLGFDGADPSRNRISLAGFDCDLVTATRFNLTVRLPADAESGHFRLQTDFSDAELATRYTLPPTLEVSAPVNTVVLGGNLQFQAISRSAPNGVVTWHVNGVPGGSASLGTISAFGRYSAPAVLPSGGAVTIGASLISDPEVSQAVKVFLEVPASAGGVGTVTAAQGGRVESDDHRAAIVASSGAVATDLRLSVARLTGVSLPLAPPGEQVLGAVQLGPDGTAFNQPVEIRVPLSVAQLAGARLHAAYYQANTGGFVDIPGGGQVTDDGNTAVVRVAHFSTVVVTWVPPASAGEIVQITGFESAVTPILEGMTVPVRLRGSGLTPDARVEVLRQGVTTSEVVVQQWLATGNEAGLLLHAHPNQNSPANEVVTYTLRLTRHNPDRQAEVNFEVVGLNEFYALPGHQPAPSGTTPLRFSEVYIPADATVSIESGAADWEVTGPVGIYGKLIGDGAPGRDSHDVRGIGGPQGGSGGLGVGQFASEEALDRCVYLHEWEYCPAPPDYVGRPGDLVTLDLHGRPQFGGGGAAGESKSFIEDLVKLIVNAIACGTGLSPESCVTTIEEVVGVIRSIINIVDNADAISRGAAIGHTGQGGSPGDYSQPASGGHGGGGGGGGGVLNLFDAGEGGGAGGEGGRAVHIVAHGPMVIGGSITTRGGRGGSGGEMHFAIQTIEGPVLDGGPTNRMDAGGSSNRGGGGGGGSGGNLVLISDASVSRDPHAFLSAEGGSPGDALVPVHQSFYQFTRNFYGIPFLVPSGRAPVDYLLRVSRGRLGRDAQPGYSVWAGPLIPVSQIADGTSGRQVFTVELDESLCAQADERRLNPHSTASRSGIAPWTITVKGELPGQSRNVQAYRGAGNKCLANLVLFPGFNSITATSLLVPEHPLLVRRVLALVGPDTDGDGLSDGDEIALHTDPRAPDTDGDGLPDLNEVVQGSNPLNGDTDGDCVLDGVEVAVLHTSPTQVDTDEDGLWDGAEPFVGGDPTDPDKVYDGGQIGRLFAHFTTPAGADTQAILDLSSGQVGVTGTAPVAMDTFAIDRYGRVHFTHGSQLYHAGVTQGDWARLGRAARVGDVHTTLPGLPLRLVALAMWPDDSLLGLHDNGNGDFTFVLVGAGSGLVTQIGAVITSRLRALVVTSSGEVFGIRPGADASPDELVPLDPFGPTPIGTGAPLIDVANGAPLRQVRGLAFNESTLEWFLSEVPAGGTSSKIFRTALGGSCTLLQTFKGTAEQLAIFPCLGFSATPPITSLLTVDEVPSALAIGDVTGDGVLDAVVAGGVNSHVSLYQGDGLGHFVPLGLRQPVGDPQSTPGPPSIELGDINGDGFADVVSASPSATIIGAAHVGPVIIVGSAGGLSTPTHADSLGKVKRLWLGDFDNRNGLDILATLHDTTFILGRNDGAGHFTLAPPLTPFPLDVYSARAADLDGDGVAEIAMLRGTQVHVWHGLGDGAFGAAPVSMALPHNLTGVDSLSLQVSDLNLDGKPDILVNGLLWFANASVPGTLSFKSPVEGSSMNTSPFAIGNFTSPVARDVILYERFAGGELFLERISGARWVSLGIVFLDRSPDFDIVDLQGAEVFSSRVFLRPLVTLDRNAIKVLGFTCP